MYPAWFREDLERLFGLLAIRAIRPRVVERISFDEVAEAHRRLEAGGLEGRLVLCRTFRRDATECRFVNNRACSDGWMVPAFRI